MDTQFLNNRWTIPVVTAAAAFTGGVAAGYIWGNRKATITVVPAEEPDEDDNQLSLFDPPAEPVAPKPRSNIQLESILKAEGYSSDEEHVPEVIIEEPKVVNVFVNGGSEWNYEAERSSREGKLIYTIHRDEFFADEMGYTQETVTYYAGDDILADARDTPVWKYRDTYGELEFGHGSNDANVVYVRNEGLGMEWEVLLHTGKFEVEVLGHTIEKDYEEADLKHSVSYRLRRSD